METREALIVREAKEKATRARQRQERFAKQDDSENGSNEKKGSKGKKKGEKKGSKGSEGTDGEMPSYVPQVDLTGSVYQVVLQKRFPHKSVNLFFTLVIVNVID